MRKWILLHTLLIAINILHGQGDGLDRFYIENLKKQLASSPEDMNKSMLLAKLSYEYIWFDVDSGILIAESGLSLSNKLNFKYGEASCSINLCIGLIQRGDFTNALDYGFKALSYFEGVHDEDNIRTAHGILLICYRDQGDYEQALIHGYKAKAVGQMSSKDSVTLLGNISSVYEKSNNLDSALFYGLKVHQLDKTYIPVLITLGNIYSKKKNFEMALNFYEKGMARAVGWSLMDLCLGRAKVYKLNDQIDSSIFFTKKSLLVGEKIGNPLGMHDASKFLSMLYETKNRPDSVVKYLKLAVSLNDSLFNNQKTREAQSFAFNEKLHQQELKAHQVKFLNKFRIYGLLGILIFTLFIAFIQFRNNKRKHNVNIQLQHQKEKVEITLAELKATQSQLIHSEKMASLGELTAGIAHEIQNPLNFVNNFSEINSELITEMDKEIDKGNISELKSILNVIKENEQKIIRHGKRADAIVKGMLQHSQASTGKKELTDINSLAGEYMRLAYNAYKSKEKNFAEINPIAIGLITEYDYSMPFVNVIPQDIGRVLLNLFNNAFWAVGERRINLAGLSDITFKDQRGLSNDSNANLAGSNSAQANANLQGFSPQVTLTTKNFGDHIEIRIADNGPGIPPHIIDKIFQPFFTTKPTGQGTGLGLSLAYDIIKAHGGELKVQTKEGEGSVFIIILNESGK